MVGSVVGWGCGAAGARHVAAGVRLHFMLIVCFCCYPALAPVPTVVTAPIMSSLRGDHAGRGTFEALRRGCQRASNR